MATAFVIFGATGDLATKRIFPSLFELFRQNLLPEKLHIIASARTRHATEEFLANLKKTLNPDEKTWNSFAKTIQYFSSDVAQNENLVELNSKLAQLEKSAGVCLQRIFYMAIPINNLEKAAQNLGAAKLHLGCSIHGKKARIVVEKPFGWDLTSAQRLNSKLIKLFGEENIYRIDHYLGKETVQNIFAFRFGNELFQPIWNNQYIDHVQITAAEPQGIENRGEYYEKAGALRDFIQNHLLQLMSIIAMEQPAKFTAPDIREKKLEIIKNIAIPTRDQIKKNTVRGQYQGYRQEPKVSPNSQTETYTLVKLNIKNKRWQGVPFYLRTGKKLTGKATSIILAFKEKGQAFFENFWDKPMPNHITIQIQPNEGIGLRLVAKKPGLSTQLEPVDMEFCYKRAFDIPQPDAYERLLMDIVAGDQMLFLPQKVIEQSWKIIDPIEISWRQNQPPLATYEPGSWGPKEADEMIARDGRQWLAPILTICKI